MLCCCSVQFYEALKELLLVKGANGFNFENQLAIEKSVGLLAGDAMRSGDLLPWWGVQVAETGREKRLLKDVLMCFGGHQCAELDENCWPFMWQTFWGKRRQARHPSMLTTPEVALWTVEVAYSAGKVALKDGGVILFAKWRYLT